MIITSPDLAAMMTAEALAAEMMAVARVAEMTVAALAAVATQNPARAMTVIRAMQPILLLSKAQQKMTY
uniref:Uncharacterized protein n=1 Tax=Rheinheimera sp. BAL341 TaxID=1708203 RepID=A0A486XP28_9GAMM